MILHRRGFILMASSAMLGACGNGIGSDTARRIDARVDAAQNYLFDHSSDAQELAKKAHGVLYMPLITEAGFGVGGSYGQGALRIQDATVDYYSATQATFGFQIGAQQYAHALFFMTSDSLNAFRSSRGWAAGADVEYAFNKRGSSVSADTTTARSPVIAFVYGQAGFMAGATLDGTKYNRIIP